MLKTFCDTFVFGSAAATVTGIKCGVADYINAIRVRFGGVGFGNEIELAAVAAITASYSI